MKLSYTLATPDTASEKMLAFRGDMKENFRQLAALGYQGVELMVRDPKELDVNNIKEYCREYNVEIASVSSGQLRAEDKLQLCSLDKSIATEATKRTKEVIDFAAEFGVQVNIGSLRGFMPEGDRTEALAAVKDVFNELLAHAANRGIDIALEPQNRYTINWLNTAAETITFIRQFEYDNLKMVFDVYHWLLEEGSLYASLVKAFPYVTHIQFSDSNRMAPGWGQLNFPDIVRVLRALDYRGFISIECLQRPGSYEAAQQSVHHLQPFITETDPI